MRLDGARSATRREPEGGTCATCVTRGTIDFQARDNFELRDEDLQGNFRCGALKVGFKQKLVPRVTRVAHVPRWSKIQVRSPAPCWLQGYLQARSAQSNFQSPFRRGALKAAFKVA